MNMPITIENYEAFYLDYLEGNLSGETLVAFEAFLAAHPELSVDDDALVTLPVSEESFDAVQKLSMKKGINMAIRIGPFKSTKKGIVREIYHAR